MKRLVLYEDLEGNEMVMICDSKEFYSGVFDTNPKPKIIDEIGIEGDLTDWPTNRVLTADF